MSVKPSKETIDKLIKQGRIKKTKDGSIRLTSKTFDDMCTPGVDNGKLKDTVFDPGRPRKPGQTDWGE